MPKFRLSHLTLPVSSGLGGTSTEAEAAQSKLSPLQLIGSNPRGNVNSAAINRLKKAELQEELGLRGLLEEGSREVLRKRLNQAIRSEQPASTGMQKVSHLQAAFTNILLVTRRKLTSHVVCQGRLTPLPMEIRNFGSPKLKARPNSNYQQTHKQLQQSLHKVSDKQTHNLGKPCRHPGKVAQALEQLQ